MNRNMLGGIIVLIVLIGIAGVILIFTSQDNKVALVPKTKELLKDIPKQQPTNAKSVDLRQPPHGETHETEPAEASIYTRENVLNIPGVIPSLTPEQVKAWQVQQQEREAKLQELAAQQPKREPHSHDSLSPSEHQQAHSDFELLVVEGENIVSESNKLLDSVLKGSYKSIEEFEKTSQGIRQRLNALKELRRQYE